MLSPKQILEFIQPSIRPAIVYSMCLGIDTPYDIHMLDSILARIAKTALGLPLSTPTALILKDRSKAGVGLMSLMVDNVQINTAYLKRKYCTPMEFQDRGGRNDCLKLEFEEYLKKRKKSKGQPPLAPQLDAPEADILEEIDRAISENNNNQASGKRPTSNPPAGLTSLPEFTKWMAQ